LEEIMRSMPSIGKKIVSSALLVAMLAAILLAGTACRKNPPDLPVPAPTDGAEPGQPLIVALGRESENSAVREDALVQALEKIFPENEIRAVWTDGSRENIAMLAGGQAAFALVSSSALGAAYGGQDEFVQGKVKGLTTAATLFSMRCQVIVPAKSDIQSVQDLKGRQICIGPKGSDSAMHAARILSAYGLGEGDYTRVLPENASCAGMLGDQKADALILAMQTPDPVLTELFEKKSVRMLPIDLQHAALLSETAPYYRADKVSAGFYPGQTADVDTVSVQTVLAASESVEEELVYKIAQALFQQPSELLQAIVPGGERSAQEAIAGVTVPFHPGAERYYREAGLFS
jgi:TRAP transporter TAXI family solute receptor